MQCAYPSSNVFADVLSFTLKKKKEEEEESIYTDTLPHLSWSHCAIRSTYSKKIFLCSSYELSI